MDQKKIGKFLANSRKAKKLTQKQLSERLGVSDRSISKWETGRCMPDLSLFEPLCKELDITINELLSGEHLEKERYQETLEENMIHTIDYSSKLIKDEHRKISVILLIIGLICSISSFRVLDAQSNWSAILSIIGYC